MSGILSRKLKESARTVNWSTHTWPLQHVGLKRAGLLTSQLRAPRASVLIIKTDTPWPFTTKPHKSLDIASAYFIGQSSYKPTQEKGHRFALTNRRSVKVFATLFKKHNSNSGPLRSGLEVREKETSILFKPLFFWLSVTHS